MGYSTGWRSWWRILKQHLCIWQFFIVLLCATGNAVCSPCALSRLWVILAGGYGGAALCGSYLWRPSTSGIKHLLLHNHTLYLCCVIPGFHWPQGRLVHPSVFGEQSVYPCSLYIHIHIDMFSLYIHTHIHIYILSLSLFSSLSDLFAFPPCSLSSMGLGTEVREMWLHVPALPCLIWGLQLPWSWRGQGHELGRKPLALLWVPYGLFFTTGCDSASPKICLPRQQIGSGHSCPGIFWQLILIALPKA